MEQTNQNSDLDLPQYEGEPSIVTESATRPVYRPIVQLVQVSQEFSLGSFIEGKVKITPFSDVISSHLVVYLSGIEQIKGKKSIFGCGSFTKCRRFNCGQTIIPLTEPLKAGFVYEFKFSLYPSLLELSEKCECKTREQGVVHMAPPSVGGVLSVLETPHPVSVRYFVFAELAGTNFVNSKYIFFSPGGKIFDLSQFRDDVSSLDRVYEAGCSLKSGLLKKVHHGTVAIRSNPVYHTICIGDKSKYSKGKLSFSVVYYTSQDPAPKLELSAKYTIQRILMAIPNGLSGKLDENKNKSEFEVASGNLDLGKAVWSSNVLQVETDYEIQNILFQTPTYASCMSYGGYELTITIKHEYGYLSLTVPFVVEASALPCYSPNESLIDNSL